MVTPAATAASRASVTGRPSLLAPSPEMSITRRVATKPQLEQQAGAEVDGAADRGPARQRTQGILDRLGEGVGAGLVLDHPPAHHLVLAPCVGPGDVGQRDTAMVAAAHRLDEQRVPQRVQVALDLHAQPLLADAAGAVHRQYQRHIDLGARLAFDCVRPARPVSAPASARSRPSADRSPLRSPSAAARVSCTASQSATASVIYTKRHAGPEPAQCLQRHADRRHPTRGLPRLD